MISFSQYTTFVYIWIFIALAVFVVLLFINAPYGRHTKTTWGPLIDNKIAWFIMEFIVLVILYFFLFTGTNHMTLVSGIIVGIFSLHYINRSIIYPIRIKTKGKKMPVVILFFAMCFNLINGFLIGYYLGNFRIYPIGWLSSPQFIVGIIIFSTGMFINWQSDNILIGLRKPSETGYSIPTGAMFKYISVPNLLGEIIEWLGFAILLWGLPGWAFFIWTFANLVPRAISHHKWYLQNFPDYPTNRKAIIPFIF